nr:hypothetical protein CTI12_AA053730 [Tanacetum cinerariifolium]
MTRSSIKELFSPLENAKQKFRSKRRLFDTSSFIESNLPEFDQISNIEEQPEEEVWFSIIATEFAYWAPNIESTEDKSMTESLKRNDDEGPSLDGGPKHEEPLDVDNCEILEDHFDGDRRNDTIEDNADVNPSTNVYLDVNQKTSIPEVVEDLSSLTRSSDKAE